MAEWLKPDPPLPEWKVSVTSVIDGNMSFRYGPFQRVQTARQKALDQLGLSHSQVLSLSLDLSYGVHWLEVLPAHHPILQHQGYPAEGVWMPAHVGSLFLLVGDCFPIALYDPSTRVIGIFHGGRPELQAGLLPDFLNLGRQHGINLQQTKVFIGPGICPEHYVFQTISPDLKAKFSDYIRMQNGASRVDLKNFVLDTLGRFKINRLHIFSDNRCTFESSDLFSHRRSQNNQEARFALVHAVESG